MSTLPDDVWLHIFSALDIPAQLKCASASKSFELLLVKHTWKKQFQWFDNRHELLALDKPFYERLFQLNATSIVTLVIGHIVRWNSKFGRRNQYCYSYPENLSFFLSQSLPNLRCLRVDSKYFDDELSALVASHCPLLEELKVTGSAVNTKFIRQMRGVKKLHVPQTELSGHEALNLLIDLALTEMDISGSMATTNMLEHLGAQDLEMVGLSAFALDADLPGSILSKPKLKMISFQFPEIGSTDIDFIDQQDWPNIFECIGIYVSEVGLMDKENLASLQSVLDYMPNVKILHLDAKDVLIELTSLPTFENLAECHLHNGAKADDIKQCLTHFEQLNHVYVHEITETLVDRLPALYTELVALLQDQFKAETVTVHLVGPYGMLLSCLIREKILTDPAENAPYGQWPGLVFKFENREAMTKGVQEKASYLVLQLNGSCSGH